MKRCVRADPREGAEGVTVDLIRPSLHTHAPPVIGEIAVDSAALACNLVVDSEMRRVQLVWLSGVPTQCVQRLPRRVEPLLPSRGVNPVAWTRVRHACRVDGRFRYVARTGKIGRIVGWDEQTGVRLSDVRRAA